MIYRCRVLWNALLHTRACAGGAGVQRLAAAPVALSWRAPHMHVHRAAAPPARGLGGPWGRASSPAELRSEQSRTLRNSIISLAVFFILVAGLLTGVPGLRSAAERITDADLSWVAAGVVLELLSCLGYVVLFELVFGMLARRTATRLSLSELAMNSVVSVSGLAGIALGAWVLRTEGVSVERIAKRSV